MSSPLEEKVYVKIASRMNPAGLVSAAAAAIRPRSDSLASLSPPISSSAALSRSRRKRMLRSSLELLDGKVASSASSAGPVTGDEGVERYRKKAPVRTGRAESWQLWQSSGSKRYDRHRRQRQMSPRSKSKLRCLAERVQSRLDPPSSYNDASARRRTAARAKRAATERGKESSAIKSARGVRDHDDIEADTATIYESEGFSVSKNPNLHRTKPPKKRAMTKKAFHLTEPIKSPIIASNYLTPKTDRASAIIRILKKSPGTTSFSPLDYRPQNGPIDDGMSVASTPMLQSYVKQWLKPSPGDVSGSVRSGRAHAGGNGWTRVDEGFAASPRKADDPSSSSVISTSSNSDNDGEEEGVYESKRLVTKASHSEISASRRDERQLPPQENDGTPSPPPRTDKNLELEYGQLAFLKQELERKMRKQKLDAEKVKPWIHNFSNVGVGAVFPTNYVTVGGGGAGNGDTSNLYGNGDTTNLSGNGENSVALVGLSSPSREAVAFGEMAFQRVMAEQRMIQLKSGAPCDEDKGAAPIAVALAAAENPPKRGQREGRTLPSRDCAQPHRGAGQRREQNSKEHKNHNNDDYFDGGDTPPAHPRSSKLKQKKKRKRRVVETITRVIHEESEEEGSTSTSGGGGRHDKNYDFESPEEEDQIVRSRTYSGEDDYANYAAVESYAGISDSGRKHISSRDRGVPHGRRKRLGYDQSDGDSIPINGNDRIICRDRGEFHGRSLPFDIKKPPRKQSSPGDRETVYHGDNVAAPNRNKGYFHLHEKKRQKRHHKQGMNRDRFHTN